MTNISETEFKKICDRLYADRHQIYRFNPQMSRRDALLWVLTGSLLSLLSITLPEQHHEGAGDTSQDPYGDAVREILRHRTRPVFDPQVYIDELEKKAAGE